MGSQSSAEEFFQRYWPEAIALGDPEQVIYKRFGIGIGSIGQFFKPDVWKAFWANRSLGVGMPIGNTMRNPGAALVYNNRMLYWQPMEHFGVQVDIDRIVEQSSCRS